MSGIVKSMKKVSAKLASVVGLGKPAKKILGLSAPRPITPMADEEEIKRTLRRGMASRAGRSGRASTILSGEDSQTLG
jgi:hypothetical protein